MLMLGIISVCFIYSAQIYSGGTQWQMQLVWLTAGGMFYLGISSMNYKILLEKGHLVYILGIVALLLVMTPIGFEKYGSRRWIDLGILRVQPTEAAKIGTLIFFDLCKNRQKTGYFLFFRVLDSPRSVPDSPGLFQTFRHAEK